MLRNIEFTFEITSSKDHIPININSLIETLELKEQIVIEECRASVELDGILDQEREGVCNRAEVLSLSGLEELLCFLDSVGVGSDYVFLTHGDQKSSLKKEIIKKIIRTTNAIINTQIENA